jgi:spore maturation protein SpmA
MTSQAISAAQSAILVVGLLGALWLGVYQVAYQDQSVGKFTTLIIYWGQLISGLWQISGNAGS